MTLHWWMHWFWVTSQIAVILASPLPSTTQDPRIERLIDESERNTSVIERISSIIVPRLIIGEKPLEESSASNYSERQMQGSWNFRVSKATTSPVDSSTRIENRPRNVENFEIHGIMRKSLPPAAMENSTQSPNRDSSRRASSSRSNESATNNDSTVEADSRITWLLTTGKTPVRRKKKKNDDSSSGDDDTRNLSTESQRREDNKDLTVLPLRIETASFKLIVNRTRTIVADSADGFSTRTINGSEDIEIDRELAEPRLSATASSIFQAGIGESTRLSRARNAFASDFQSDKNREEEISSVIDVDRALLEANESINREIETSSSSVSSSPSLVDIAAITGSCLATVVLLSTMASLGFIMYRRKYLNPPQTLNSDKCSNPDSSGYIDDSTIRDNSEEMYSLDNDSFLNSLEAMTIQNYWTDSVKHTKL